MSKVKLIIKKRIKEIKEIRDTMTGKSSKAKYNFCIGELQNLLLDLD